ncbi:MAG TPA: hypothetical protein VGR08_12330 [Thermomicrobiales bacterium]|nr:hypothetical protein [Thermomicrobiales bacterium]
MTIGNQRWLTWLVSGAIMVAVWIFGWAEPIRTASTAGEPAGDMAFIGAHVLACLVVGFLVPSLATYTGPTVLIPAVVWIIVHIVTYDGSQGASFWPVALVMILFSMPVLSMFGVLGRGLRRRFGKGIRSS